MTTKFLMLMFMIELIWIGKVIELPAGSSSWQECRLFWLWLRCLKETKAENK